MPIPPSRTSRLTLRLGALALALVAAACSGTTEGTAPEETADCAAEYQHQSLGLINGDIGEVRGLVASETYDDILWLARMAEEGPEIVGITPAGRSISGLLLGGLADVVENLTVGVSSGRPSLFVLGAEDDRGNEPRLIRIDEIDPFSSGIEPTARVFDLEMPGGSKPVALAFDAVTGDLLIVGRDRASTLIYRLEPPTDGDGLLEPATVANINTGIWPISDFDISSDTGRITMRTRNELWLWGRGPDESVISALASPVCVSAMPREGQGAAVAASSGELEYLAVSTNGPAELQSHQPTLGGSESPGWRTTNQSINVVPNVAIPTSLSTRRWEAGQEIALELEINDDQPTEPSRIEWTIEEIRCLADDSCAVLPFDSGNLTSFAAPSAGDARSALRLRATYQDAGGLEASDVVDLQPNTALLSVESEPAGATVSLGGTEVVTPAEVELVRGSRLVLSTLASQQVGDGYFDATIASEVVLEEDTTVQVDLSPIPWGFVDFAGEPGSFGDRVIRSIPADTRLISLRAFVAFDDWTPITTEAALGGGSTRLQLKVLADGRLEGRIRTVSETWATAVSTEAPDVRDGARLWIRYDYDSTTGIGTFFTSTDDVADRLAVEWTQLGDEVDTDAAGSVFRVSKLILGQLNELSSSAMDGKLFAASYSFNGTTYTVDFTSTAGLSSRPPNYSVWGAWTLRGPAWTYVPAAG